MNYLLDTNAWLQLGQAPTQIPLRVRKILLAENAIALSPISIIEIAQKQTNGRLTLSAPLEEWVSKALFAGLKLLPLTPEIACDAYRIPDFHGDPADRIIAATARAHQLTLVTCDRKLIASPHVKTLSTR
jgi:PIN domain nuclease of toxin-antitoxin system